MEQISEIGVLTKPEGEWGNLLYGSGINIDPGCKLNITQISKRMKLVLQVMVFSKVL